jgi:Trp operon repressor
MKKDIYIIKNKINDKVYIGQAVNTQNRWWHHLSDARKNKKYSLIDRAINKYGKENFYYEILEEQIEDYNEKEQYWIKKYNSITPNGYNIAVGGQGVGNGIDSPTAAIKDQETLDSIVDTILNTDLSLAEIARIYNVGHSTILEINNGTAYYNDNLKYPLKECRLSDEKFKQLIYSLKYEHDKTLQDLSKEYKLDISCINDINQGKSYKKDWLKYPLREGKTSNPLYEHHLEIIELLKNTEMEQKDIAKKFNVGCGSISNINLGRSYRQPDIEYPIRKNYQYNKIRKSFSPSEICEIEELLKTDMSIKKIAKQFETCFSIIADINNGQVKKYRKENIEYPIRKIRS